MCFSPLLFFPLPPSSSLHIPCSNHFICYRLKLGESYCAQVGGHYVRASRGCWHNTSATEYRWASGMCTPDVGWHSGVSLVWKKLCAADAKIPVHTGSRALAGPGHVPYDLHGPSAPMLLHAPPLLVCNNPDAPALNSANTNVRG
jgi:hypothetical protein